MLQKSHVTHSDACFAIVRHRGDTVQLQLLLHSIGGVPSTVT